MEIKKLIKPVFYQWTAQQITNGVYARVTEICSERGYTRLSKVFSGSHGRSVVSFLIAQVLKYTPVVRKFNLVKTLSEACEVVAVAVLEVAALDGALKYVKSRFKK